MRFCIFNSAHAELRSVGISRSRALSSVSTAALMIGAITSGAHAQTATPQTAQAPAVEEIVVTGSRIVRNGYEAPTPVSVLGVEQVENAGLPQISDFVNQLPSVAGSTLPTGTAVSSGLQGIAALNLRNLGVNRTLVLLDGQRSVASAVTGQVDAYNIPSQLVSRVDVVTGGASSAYGSDAIAGVVNFVLDKNYTGLKGEISGGVTTYGDDRNWKVALTGGTGFADDKGHFLISLETDHNDGILNCPRSWCSQGNKIMLNPSYTATNGQPNYLVVTGAGIDQGSPGGIIVSGPLKGIEFGPGGVPRKFNYGSIVKDPYTVGGDWSETTEDIYESLDSRLSRQSAFTRVSYDITDDINLFAQLSWNKTFGYDYDARQYSVANITIKGDNAFIPSAIAAQVATLNLTSFTMGSFLADLGPFATDNTRHTNRYVFGGNGKVDAFDSTWSWDGYFQSGETRASESIYNTTVKPYFANAIDAVRAPNGSIVCRSTLTNPTNGCVPFDVFGIGVNSQAAINYITNGEVGPHRNERFLENVGAFNVHGNPFSDWAGPVSIAFGIEHRWEAVHDAPTDALDASGSYFVGNFLPNYGSYNVTEGYVETVVPLAKDLSWAKSLDFNGAVRATGYSVAGYATTWKAGVTYAPIDDVHFRVTRSRDIRAPNLSELFAAGTANTNSVVDPHFNNQSIGYVGRVVGNTNLVPEVADTWGLGVVLQPTFIPGLSGSVDFYNINMKNEINTVAAQDLVDLCYEGQTQFCSALTLGTLNGAPYYTTIRLQPFNYVQVVSKGIDFEGSYTTRLSDIVDSWNGNVSLRVLATRFLKNFTNTGIPGLIPVNTAGTNAGSGPPNWRYLATLDYSGDAINVSITGRGVSSGVYNSNYIQCTSGCPTATSNNETINSNHIDGALYLDATLTYKFNTSDTSSEEAFLTVRNIMNKDPAVVHQGPTGDNYKAYAANGSLYDVLGRVFRAGIRFKM